jgi:superfamily II DNA/RNA helicase
LEEETDENGNRYFGLEVDGDQIRVMSITKFQNLEKGDVQGLRDGFDVVLIDEAHRFRNTGHWSPDGKEIKGTRRHANMKLLGEKTIIMLTATPVNNSAEDLKNLISLFTDENEIRNMSGLDFDSFDEYIDSAKERKSLIKEGDIGQSEIDRLVEKLDEKSEEIGKILEEVMVLRTRKDVKEQLKDEEEFEINFNPPEVHKRNYELPAAYRPAYDILPETMNALHLPHITIKNPNGGTLKALYKLTLLKRLESSPKAFLESLETIYDKETQLLRTLDKLPEEQKIRNLQDQESGSTLEEFVEEEDADGLREVMGEVGLDRTIKLGGKDAGDELSRATVEDIMEFIREDLVMLGKFASMFVSGIAPENRQLNEKTHELKNWLRDESLDRIPDVERGRYDERVFPSKNLEDANDRLSDFYEAAFEAEKFEDEKVKLLGETLNSIDGKAVIFTQYKPTADYVHDSLVESEDSPLTRSNSAVVKGGDSNKRDIIKRFSPGSAGYQSVVEDDTVSEIDYVVATDTLSEGVNLQDVDNAINYDLPFNPMRIVQRVGRIDRIGTESEKHVFNFFPDEDLEAAIKLLERLRAKIDDIAMIVGKENKILDPNEDEVLDRAGVEKDKKIGEVEQEKVEESIRESRNVEDVNELDDRDRNKLLGKAGSSEEEVFEKIRLQKELKEEHGLAESDFDYARSFFRNEPEDRDKIYTVLPKQSLKEADVLGLLHEWNQGRDVPLNRVDRQVLYSHSRTGNIETLNSVRQINVTQGSSCGELPDEHLFDSDVNKIKQSVNTKVHKSKQDQLKGVKKKGSAISRSQETAIEYLESELVPNNIPGAEDVLERMKQPKLKNTGEDKVLREIVFPDKDVSISDRNQEDLLDDLLEFLDEYIDDSPRYQSDLASKSEVKGEIQAWAVID